MNIPSEAIWALGKLILTFVCILVMLRLKLALWKTLAIGCVIVALLTQMPLEALARIVPGTLLSSDFIIMEVVLFGILVLSGLQSATGQSERLVEALERYLRWPRLRIIIFPALVGLLPMPGGALFSCPMLESASHGLGLSPGRKVLINYWFRHIWELAWPLYPGYILASSLLHLPLLTLLSYTAPLVLGSLLIGMFFFLRDVKADTGTARSAAEKKKASALPVLYESLPLIITLAGAAAFGVVFKYAAPALPSQAAFIASLACALITAWIQGRGKMNKSLASVVLSKQMLLLMLLIFIIFVFKNVIMVSGLVSQMSHLGANRMLIYGLFILLPWCCGMLTGVMVGYVGLSFPILLGLLSEAGLQEYTLPLTIVALVAGNIGQLITPLHVCLIVTLDYFKVTLGAVWYKLLLPLLVQMGCGVFWAMLLFLLGARL